VNGPENDLGLVNAWPKRCSCGLAHSLEMWKILPYVGDICDGVDSLEIRNCSCGSSIAQVIETRSESWNPRALQPIGLQRA
jgi:hypothetical protein